MNTTAAALEAHVTVATIRTWCRRGVVAAIKQAGRWVIDTASLAHRIAIGARRARKQATLPEQTAPDFVPFTRAELHRDHEGHRVRIAHFPAPFSSGETLVSLELHYQDGAHVHTIDLSLREPCPYSIAVHHDPSFQTELNPADAESALRAAGWAVTGPWTKRRAMLRSDVTRIG